MYLNFSGFSWRPLHQGHSHTQHEDGEPLEPAQGPIQHQDSAQRCAGNLQLVGHLGKQKKTHHTTEKLLATTR